jgi:hypothetical protein
LQEKRKALLATFKSINDKHGAGTVMTGSDQKVVDV